MINEEMYEEEDDDLPHHYRRLTAHLQTGSADFNQRLSAYLTNHVAMRSALDQAVRDSYATQAAQHAAQSQNPYLNPNGMPNPQMGYPPHMFGNGPPPPYMIPNMMPMTNAMQKHSPYLIPQPPPDPYIQQQQREFQNFNAQPRIPPSHHHSHGRSASVVHDRQSAFNPNSPVITKPESRRMSMPMAIKSESPALKSIEQPNTPISMPSLTPQLAHQERAQLPKFESSESLRSPEISHDQPYLPPYTVQPCGNDINPFATATPQGDGLYDPNLDFSNDPLMGMFMAGSEAFGTSFDTTMHNSYSGPPLAKLGTNAKPHHDGLNSTLGGGIAPAQLDAGALRGAFEFAPGLGESLKAAGAASATETPGMGPDKWNEWIEPAEWDGAAQ